MNNAMSRKKQGSPAQSNGEQVSGSEQDLVAHFLQEGELTEDEQSEIETEDAADATSEDDLSQDQPDADATAEDNQEHEEQEPVDETDESSEDDDEESDAEEEEQPEEETEKNLSDLEYPAFKKRVDKLTRQKKELETQLDSLSGRLQQLESAGEQGAKPSTANNSNDPIANVKTLGDVQEKMDEAKGVWNWGLKMLEGTEDTFIVATGKDTEEELNREDVRNIVERAQYTLQTVLPEKAQNIQQRAAYDQLAEEHYAWLADQESAEYKESQQILAAFPELGKFPDINLSLGDLVEGRKARVSRSKTKKAAPARKAPKIAPNQPSRSSSPAPINKGKAKTKDAMDAVYAGGGQSKDLENLFKQL